jgi:hypothetical protein
MAATRKQNVIISSTDGDVVTGPLEIASIKLVGGASGATVNLKDGGVTGGTTLYAATVGNSSEKWEEVKMRVDASGLYVNFSAGSGTLYIYIR